MSERSEDTVKKGSFWSNMKAELKKVTWPTKEQTVKSTATVIVFVLIITAILILLNFAFQWVNSTYWGLFQ